MKMNNHSVNLPQSHHFAEVSLRYSPSADIALKPKLYTPDEVAAYLRSIWDMDEIELCETFYILLLNNGRVCLGWSRISSGSKTATIVDLPKVITLALLGNATNIIVAHNHPSGQLKASRADIDITKRIAQALKFHDITLDDHVLITRTEHFSFRENNLLYECG